MSWIKDRALTLVLMTMFVIFLAGQFVTGFHEYNDVQIEHHRSRVTMSAYALTGHWWESVFENWESEFLQMAVFVLATTCLVQKGSPESRRPAVIEPVDADPREFVNEPGVPWPVKRGGWILKVYENSLPIALFVIFFLAFVLHAWGGAKVYSEEQLAAGGHDYSTWGYLHTAQFWFESFQNWQSEFLAVASLVVLSIFLRQRGSPESKPMAAPHSSTGA